MKEKKPQTKQPPSIFSVLKDYKLMTAGLFVCAGAVTVMNLILPKIIANAIDGFTAGNTMVIKSAILFGVLSFLVLIFLYIQNIFQAYASERVARDTRKKLSEKISRQSYVYLETVGSDKLLTNLTSDVDGIKTFVSQAVVILLSSLITIIGATVLLISINWKLALAVLAILPIIGVSFSIIFGKAGPLFKQSRESIDWLNRVINESILGATLIRVLNAHQSESVKFLAANTEAKNVGMKVLGIFASIIPIITFVASLATVVILALGGHFVIGGSMSLGDFSAFTSYVSLLIFPIIMMGFISNMLAQAQASYARISNVLSAEELAETGTDTTTIAGDISVNNLTFTTSEKTILKDISFHIPRNTKTAIIGPTAAGKTQLLYLLIGLIDPTSGTILYDNKPLGSYNAEYLHRRIGFVFQESIIFNLSLRENIAFSTGVTESDLAKAISTAELDDFVTSLPQGLDTVISERGSNLSGGQKQRVMLARALAMNPQILLLDDFTARVDTGTEKKILENISKNYPNLTLVSVTQKIASVEHYDRIMVLMEGELIAEGTHTELLESSVEYVQIVESQKSTNAYE